MAVIRFTDRTIKTLKTDKRQEDFFDADFTGGSFICRVSQTGGKAFVFAFRLNGQRGRVTIGPYPAIGLAEARAKALQMAGQVARGEDPREPKRAIESFGQLADEYLEKHARPRKRPRSVAEDERILKAYLLPAWKLRRPDDINRRQVAELLDGQKPVMANRIRSLASKIFNFAIARDLLDANPCLGIPRNPEQSRERVLTDEEIKQVWKALETEPEPMATAFRLILLTGQRPGEVCQMRWADLDGDLWKIPSAVAKNKLSHRVPLSAQALACLEALRPLTGESEHVFESPMKPGRPLRWLRAANLRIRKTSNVQFKPHDLRRTCATGMRTLGVDLLTVQAVLNHKRKGVSAVYDRYAQLPEMKRALDRWARHIEAVITGETAKVVQMIS